MNSNEIILHGEATVSTVSFIPINAKKKNVKGQSFVIIADSETTGNHHVVDVADDIDFYEDDKGVLFMENKISAQIRCVHENRHDAITIPPGTYEFGIQKEYDPFAARMRNVVD